MCPAGQLPLYNDRIRQYLCPWAKRSFLLQTALPQAKSKILGWDIRSILQKGGQTLMSCQLIDGPPCVQTAADMTWRGKSAGLTLPQAVVL